MTSSIIETMINIRITPMSMKTVMKERRRKTEEAKNKNMPGGETTGICIFMWRLRTNIN